MDEVIKRLRNQFWNLYFLLENEIFKLLVVSSPTIFLIILINLIYNFKVSPLSDIQN